MIRPWIILKILEELVDQKDVLGLIERIGGEPSLRRTPTTSLVDESVVYGRAAEKEAIMKLLLSDDTKGRHLDVILIVGMGGVGKTTLAQLLYKEMVVSNDRSLKSSFDLKAWVYVSEELDVLEVTKNILKGVGLMNCDIMTEDQLHCELEKEIVREQTTACSRRCLERQPISVGIFTETFHVSETRK